MKYILSHSSLHTHIYIYKLLHIFIYTTTVYIYKDY